MRKQRWHKMEVKALIIEFNMKWNTLKSMLSHDEMQYVEDLVNIMDTIDRKTFRSR